MSTITKRKLFFTMVLHPFNGWTRVGNAYTSKEQAQEWLPMVRGSWYMCKCKISQFTAIYIDGKLSDKSKEILDKKFNLDS